MTIPKEIVKVEDLREGEAVVIKLKKVAKSGFGVIRGMRSFKKEDELTGQLEEK